MQNNKIFTVIKNGLLSACLLVIVVMAIPSVVTASCTNSPSVLAEGSWSDACITVSGQAEGRAVYNCGNYNFGIAPAQDWKYGCYIHMYTCTTGCGSPGVGGGGGGGECPQWSAVNCAAGSTADLTQLVSTITGPINAECGAGSAQVVGACSNWWCNEPVGEGCGEWICKGNWHYIYQYACVAPCSSPAAPTLTSPVDGAQIANPSVSLLWNSVTFSAGCTGSYKVYVGTTNPPTTLETTVGANVTSASFTATPGTTYYWYVQALNGTAAASSAVSSFTVLNNQIAGTVYYDPGNTCSTATPWNQGAGLSASLRGTAYSASVPSGGASAGVYSITAQVGQTYGYLDLAGLPATFVCSTAVGCNSCPTLTNIDTPSTGNNFFLTDKREPWWQAVGAGVYAGGLGGGVLVRSETPSASDHLIEPGAGGAIGALLRASGSVDIGAGSISTPGYSATARYKGKIMGYEFFAAQMGVIPSQANDWGADTMNKPANNPERDFFYLDPTSGTASISSPWVVSSGESYVVFVNGNLQIDQDITVANGGFLAFVVNGSVTVSPTVAQVQGLYVIDTQFVTESQYSVNVTNDVPLAVEGSVVAWGGVSLGRDLGLGNSTTPGEQFSYRPDLLINMPQKMKVFALRWKEVVPGTFGQ